MENKKIKIILLVSNLLFLSTIFSLGDNLWTAIDVDNGTDLTISAEGWNKMFNRIEKHTSTWTPFLAENQKVTFNIESGPSEKTLPITLNLRESYKDLLWSPIRAPYVEEFVKKYGTSVIKINSRFQKEPSKGRTKEDEIIHYYVKFTPVLLQRLK